MAQAAPQNFDMGTISALIKKILEENKPTAELPDPAKISASAAAAAPTGDTKPAQAPDKPKPQLPQTQPVQSLTDSILNMNQIMPVQKAAATQSGGSGGAVKNIMDMFGGGGSGGGAATAGGGASNAAAAFQSIGKLLALLG